MRMTVRQVDTRCRYIQVVREQSDHRFVCLAIGWCCRCPDTQAAIADAKDLIAAGPRLHSNPQNQIVVAPVSGAVIAPTQIGNGLSVAMKMPLACNAMITKIGEISSPPMAGIRLLKGRITGSTSIDMKAVAGL